MLSIAEGTVKRHTTNMYEKLGATSRIDAVRKAARLGLLE
jgi:ATP/maltotriose-dependent transcriptional regulator MalT